MGSLDLLFDEATPDSGSDIEISDRYIRISSIGFYGEFALSPSKEWILAWSDTNSDGSRGGQRTSSHGQYVLYNTAQKKIVHRGHVERPNSGHVADNGTFSLKDWRFGDGPIGTFYVFASDGRVLVKDPFNANILNSGLSENGLLAVCQTCIANHDDGNKLKAFDVANGTTLFRVSPVTEWARDYTFSEQNKFVAVILDHIGTFWYDFAGTFLNAPKYRQARLECNQFDVVLFVAKEILEGPELNADTAIVALTNVIRARSLGADNDPSWKSKALKLQGIAYEYLQQTQNALSAFEEAIAINPKIGVKRKIAELRKLSGES